MLNQIGTEPNTWGFLLIITFKYLLLIMTLSYYYHNSQLYPFKLWTIFFWSYCTLLFSFPSFILRKRRRKKTIQEQQHTNTHGSRLFFGIQQQHKLFIFDVCMNEGSSMKRMKLGRLCSSSLRWFWLLPCRICSKIPTFLFSL